MLALELTFVGCQLDRLTLASVLLFALLFRFEHWASSTLKKTIQTKRLSKTTVIKVLQLRLQMLGA